MKCAIWDAWRLAACCAGSIRWCTTKFSNFFFFPLAQYFHDEWRWNASSEGETAETKKEYLFHIHWPHETECDTKIPAPQQSETREEKKCLNTAAKEALNHQHDSHWHNTRAINETITRKKEQLRKVCQK